MLDLLGAPMMERTVIQCTPPVTPVFAPGDLSKIGTPNRADPVIQPFLPDARANPPGSEVKPYVLGDMKRAIRTMKSICPVPLSRPSSQLNDHNDQGHGGHGGHGGHAGGEIPEDPSLARTRQQIVDMLASGQHCKHTMETLKKRISIEQAEECKQVYDQLAIADVDTAKREWMLMKDRHSRSKQDLWALARELKQVLLPHTSPLLSKTPLPLNRLKLIHF